MTRYARIVGTGHYAPKKVMTNADFIPLLGQDVDEFVGGVLNIHERRVCAEDESTADLSVQAGQRALEAAGISASDLDLIIIGTDTPETISPATASKVQYLLGAGNAGTFDVNCACAGFVTGLDIGAKYIAGDEHYRNVLVVGAYAMTKFLDFSDLYTATIFADGAGAVVLQAADEPGFLGSRLKADGQYHDYMGIYAGGAYHPITRERLEAGEHYVRFVKKFPQDLNSSTWPQLAREVVKQTGRRIADIDFIIFTQININTIREVMATLDLPLEKTHWVMDHYGYTGSACIPMVLDEAVRAGRIKSGDLVVMVASGGGYAMAAAAFLW